MRLQTACKALGSTGVILESNYIKSSRAQGIRNWLSGFEHLAYQETLTDYLRVALGHVVIDEIERRGEYYDEDDLVKRAYRSFVARGFNRKYYRRRR